MNWILRDTLGHSSQGWCIRPRHDDCEVSTNGSVSYDTGDGYGDSPANGRHDMQDIDETAYGWGCEYTDGFQKQDGSGNTMRPLND
jgi:hypothetical protein